MDMERVQRRDTKIIISPVRKRCLSWGIRKHCYWEDDGALAQASQGGCGVSILGDVKNPAGRSPDQPVLGGSA